MQYLTVVIPTRNRIKKLEKTLESIPDLSYIRIEVICDGDYRTYHHLNEKYKGRRIDTVRMIKDHSGSVKCRNLSISQQEDGVLYATDDIVFHTLAIQNAYECFNKMFPDDDGVVGFIQVPGGFHETGVALVGQTFLRRFPSRKLFYPNYFHFSCQEVYSLCQDILNKKGKNVFYQHKEAVVTHYHPCKYKHLVDTTHQEARVQRRNDLMLSQRRKREGLIWGEV